MTALGQSALGSYFYSDTRNVFRNASEVNGTKDYVVTEMGANAAGGSGGTAEGGFFRSMGSLNYGVYLNSDQWGNLAGGALAPARLDLFVGGEMGVTWGVRAGYEAYSSGDTTEGSSFDIGLGVQVAGANIWFNMNPGATDKFGGTETKTDSDMNLGATYGLGGWTAFFEYNTSGGSDATTDDSSTMELGAGRVSEGANGARLYTDVRLQMGTDVNSTGAVAEGNGYMRIPLTVGYEAAALSWLTVRGSISQSLFGSSTTKAGSTETETSAQSTAVALGATLNFGALQIDGDLTSTGAGAIGTNALANMSVHYWF
jgi:hypothetical protein